MATWIPALGTCAARMTAGKRWLAERLEQKLEGDYLMGWDDGPEQTRLDFVVLHPRRCVLMFCSCAHGPCTRKPAAPRAPSRCYRQFTTYGQVLPPRGESFYEGLVGNIIRAIDRNQIPGGKYQAMMIDEGHDFAPEWLRLIATDNLLVLYEDAQSIYERWCSKKFSFKNADIQGQGRITILKISYRNRRQILYTSQACCRSSAHCRRERWRKYFSPQNRELRARGAPPPHHYQIVHPKRRRFCIANHWQRPPKKALRWAKWQCCAPTGKPWTCALMPLAQRKLRHRVRKKTANSGPVQARFK